MSGWVSEIGRGKARRDTSGEDIDKFTTHASTFFGGWGDDRPAFLCGVIVDGPV